MSNEEPSYPYAALKMREQLPTNKRAGQGITPRHINDLSRIFSRFARGGVGGNRTGHHGDSFVSDSNDPPWDQGIFIITESLGDDQFKGQARYYDEQGQQWQTDTSHEGWDIDAKDVADTLAVSDKVVCYWDEQRGAFIPICCGIVPISSSSSSSPSLTSQSSSFSSSSSPSSASSTSVACRCRGGECIWEWNDYSSVSGLGGTGEWILISNTCTGVCQPEKECLCANGPTRDGLFDGEQWIGDCVEP